MKRFLSIIIFVSVFFFLLKIEESFSKIKTYQVYTPDLSFSSAFESKSSNRLELRDFSLFYVSMIDRRERFLRYFIRDIESKKIIELNQLDEFIKDSFRNQLYRYLIKHEPDYFYRGLFYRMTLIQPQISAIISQVLNQIEKNLSLTPTLKLKNYFSNHYSDFGQRNLELTVDEEENRNFICFLIDQKMKRFEQAYSKTPLVDKERKVFRLLDERFLTIEEALKASDSRKAYVFLKFYQSLFCKAANSNDKNEKSSEICIENENDPLTGEIYFRSRCQKPLFSLKASFDQEKKTFQTKTVVFLDRIRETKILSKAEKELILSLYEIDEKQATNLKFEVFSLSNFDRYYLDNDYLFYLEFINLVRDDFGILKSDLLNYFISELKNRYSLSEFSSYSHGRAFILSSNHLNTNLLSPVRRTKRNSCIGRALNAYFVSSIISDDSFFIYLGGLDHLRQRDEIGHAVVISQIKDENSNNSRFYLIDNLKILKPEKRLDHTAYERTVYQFLKNKNLIKYQAIKRKKSDYYLLLITKLYENFLKEENLSLFEKKVNIMVEKAEKFDFSRFREIEDFFQNKEEKSLSIEDIEKEILLE